MPESAPKDVAAASKADGGFVVNKLLENVMNVTLFAVIFPIIKLIRNRWRTQVQD